MNGRIDERARVAACFSLILLLAIAVTGCVDSKVRSIERCTPPPYKISERFFGPGVVHVSVTPEDVTLANLVCVAITKGTRSGLDVQILDSADAADEFFELPLIGDGDFSPRIEARRHRRATFHAGVPGYVSIHLFGGVYDDNGVPDDEAYSTRIDLPLTTTPRCRFEIARRCLLAADYPEYPSLEIDAGEGAVTVTGQVTRSGSVENVRVLTKQSPTRGYDVQLALASVNNLKTWRFDPAHSQDPITITYRYVVDHSSWFRTVLEMPSVDTLTVKGHPGITREELVRLLAVSREAASSTK
jgi:TonB family protein